MFTKISHKLIERLEKLHAEGQISGTELILLLTISRHSWGQADNRNPCLKSSRDLAKIVGRSERQVKRALAQLREHNLIDSIYRIQSNHKVTITRSSKVADKRMLRGRPASSHFILKDPGIGTNVKLKQSNKH